MLTNCCCFVWWRDTAFLGWCFIRQRFGVCGIDFWFSLVGFWRFCFCGWFPGFLGILLSESCHCARGDCGSLGFKDACGFGI